jgi:cyclase
MRGVDELIILDISATQEQRGPDLAMVRELSETCFMPLTIGGGVRTLLDIEQLLRAGADKVAICTAALEDHGFIASAANRFGSSTIVCVVEYRGKFITSQSGRKTHPFTPRAWAMLLSDEGAGEIMLSCVDCDGMMQGYDINTLREVTQNVSVPVIVSGGAGTYEHMLDAFQVGADACASGAMFSFTESTPKGAAIHMKANGIEIRT